MSSIGSWWERTRQRQIDDAWKRRDKAVNRQVKRSWKKQVTRNEWVDKKAPHALAEYTLKGVMGGAFLATLGLVGLEALNTQSIPTLSDIIETLTHMKDWVEVGAGVGGVRGLIKGAEIKYEANGEGYGGDGRDA